MMDKEAVLVKEGAWYHCARLIYRGQDVGLRGEDGVLTLTEAGEEIYTRLADVTDVEVKPARARKAKAETAPTEETNLDQL